MILLAAIILQTGWYSSIIRTYTDTATVRDKIIEDLRQTVNSQNATIETYHELVEQCLQK